MTCARLTLTRARYSSRQPWWTIHNHLPSVRSLATQPSGSKGGISSSSSSSSSSRPGGAKGGPQPPPPSTVAYNKQRRREWVLVGVAGSAAGLGGWYFFSARTKHHAASSSAMPSDSRAFSLSSNARTSFSIPLRSSAQPGGPTHSVITTLTPSEVDKRLRENERSTNVDRPAGACLVARYDTNSVASNDPIEDKRAEVIVERDRGLSDSDRARSGPVDGGQKAVAAAAEAVPAVKGDLCFFAVMDGHAGYHTSTLLSQKLIAFVALELDKVFREAGEYANVAKAKAAMPTKMWRMLFGGPEASASPTPGGLDGDPEIVKRAIAKAFRSLDKEIVNTPVELLKEWELSLASTASSSPPGPAAPSRVAGSNAPGGTRSLSSLARSIFPSSSNVPFSGSAFTATQKSAYESILPALSGSCALLTYVDSARKDVYVACTGDSRAVAGYWDEKAGRWRVEALSVDQTGRNMSEVKRMRAEHPASEADHVVMRGRVLGGLEPTRAFGDARYKWDRGLQERLYDAFLPGGRASTRGPPRGLETPPYVTAQPEVEWRRLGESGGPGELRFMVMATDGLWDMLPNEEVVALVAGHLAGIRGTVLASDLSNRCFSPGRPSSPASSSAPSSSSNPSDRTADAQTQALNKPKGHPLSKGPEHLRAFTFEDENLSTHLVRNALGGADRDRVAGLLAIPSPESRRYRDDITVSVILFDSTSNGNGSANANTNGNATGPDEQDAKASAAEGSSLPKVATKDESEPEPKAKL